MQASLEFHLELPASRVDSLIDGYLLVKQKPTMAGVKLVATSGTRTNQYSGSWNIKGRGCLPPSRLLGVSGYSLSTQKLWLQNVKGVEGSFYAIAPFAVNLTNVSRGDFGIHFDANVPGSAGCIVIRRQDHWDTFRQMMEDFRLVGVQRLSLLVDY